MRHGPELAAKRRKRLETKGWGLERLNLTGIVECPTAKSDDGLQTRILLLQRREV
jgi:hypothetical protein